MISPVKIWRNQKKVAVLAGKTGVLVSWTLIRVPPSGFGDQAPYPVVIVQLSNGMQMTAQLVDYLPEHMVMGQRVMTVIRRVTSPDPGGIIPYGIKVKPL